MDDSDDSMNTRPRDKWKEGTQSAGSDQHQLRATCGRRDPTARQRDLISTRLREGAAGGDPAGFASQHDFLLAIQHAHAVHGVAPNLDSLFDFQRPVARRRQHFPAANEEGAESAPTVTTSSQQKGAKHGLQLSNLQNDALVALAGCFDVAQAGGKVALQVTRQP